MKAKSSRKPAAGPARPSKKHKPISSYYTKPEQGEEDCSGSCSPSHVDQPTPAAATAPGDRSRAGSTLPSVRGGGRQVGTTMLRSLQRRFVQQTLQTPFAAASGSLQSSGMCEDGDCCEDFVLRSSQTYERGLSQQVPASMAHDASATQDGLTQTQYCEEHARAAHELQSRLSQQQEAAQPSSSAAGQEAEEQAPRRMSNASNCSNRTTPGVRDEELVCNAAPKLFPIFRARKELKVLHIIRHGESEYNAATNGPTWEDPEIFDAPLTARGKRQALALRQQLASMDLPADVLWVTSPLSRAMQTLLLACPALQGGSGGAPTIIVRSEITEKMATTGDVGHPASVLVQRFPQLAEQLQTLPEVWWHCDPDNPNCALTKKFVLRETKQQLQRRIGEFTKWLQSRPEQVIVAVGHSSYWRELMKGQLGEVAPAYLKNCELATLKM